MRRGAIDRDISLDSTIGRAHRRAVDARADSPSAAASMGAEGVHIMAKRIEGGPQHR